MEKEIKLLEERVNITSGAGKGVDAGYDMSNIKTKVIVKKKIKDIEGIPIVLGSMPRSLNEKSSNHGSGYTDCGLGKIEVDFIDMPVSVANGLRRILTVDLPTVAIEKVFILNNTGVLYDEHLASRLGLIPILCDPYLLEFKGEESPHENNTVILNLNVEGPKVVTSGDLRWIPHGDQAAVHNYGIRAVFDDIVITELVKGQKISAELHCHKGCGREHAKWSSVSLATYRLHPYIKLLQPIKEEKAVRLQKSFVSGVIGVKRNNQNELEAYVDVMRNDTGHREVLRHDDLKDLVSIQRIPGYYIFTVESIGIISADRLLLNSMDYIIDKIDEISSEFKKAIVDQGITNKEY